MDIEFDPAKDEANIAKHDVSLRAAAELEIQLIVRDDRHEYGEDRGKQERARDPCCHVDAELWPELFVVEWKFLPDCLIAMPPYPHLESTIKLVNDAALVHRQCPYWLLKIQAA